MSAEFETDEWLSPEMLQTVMDTLKQLGKGATISIYARAKPVTQFVSAETKLMKGVCIGEYRRTHWIEWDEDREGDYALQSEFPATGFDYARPQITPALPQRRESRRERDEEPVETSPRPKSQRRTEQPPPTQAPQPTQPPQQPTLVDIAMFAEFARALQPQSAALTPQMMLQIAELQQANAAGLAEQFASRNGRQSVEVVRGVRVPVAIDAPYTVLYPHLWLKRERPLQPLEIAEWRNEFSALLLHLSVHFKSQDVHDRFDLARDTLLTMASVMTAPQTKTDYRIWWWHAFALVECLVTALAGSSAGQKTRKALYDNWLGDVKFDFESTIRGVEPRTEEAAQASTTQPQARAVEDFLAAANATLQKLNAAAARPANNHQQRGNHFRKK